MTLTEDDIETNGDGCDTWMIIHTTQDQEALKKEILEALEFYEQINESPLNYEILSGNAYKILKDKAEKWDKAHSGFHHYYKDMEQKNQELEAQVKSLQAQLDKEKSDYYTNLEVDNSNLLDGSARLESQLQKNKEIVSKIRERLDLYEQHDNIHLGIEELHRRQIVNELKEILGDES